MRRTIAFIATLAVALGAPTSAGAQATPPFEEVMTGLDNPRGLAWGPEGALYVAEAGRGGTQPCFPARGEPTFAGRRARCPDCGTASRSE